MDSATMLDANCGNVPFQTQDEPWTEPSIVSSEDWLKYNAFYNRHDWCV